MQHKSIHNLPFFLFAFATFLSSSAIRTVPFSLWLLFQTNASKMEPFYPTIRIITCNHLSVADLVAETICGLIRINWQVQVHTCWVCRSTCNRCGCSSSSCCKTCFFTSSSAAFTAPPSFCATFGICIR
uniref:Uncharacterized protein n=1 Tax=Opuntia streptacantha TaxID=393608 RepID=A0A7C9D3H6_OPUST